MWIYPVIFFAKLVEISLSTVRNVLINRGEKLKGAIIAFFEIMIWIVLAANVLNSLSQDPFKAVVYCVAFALGNYVGVIIEGKLAIGTSCIQAVVDIEIKDALNNALREKGFGVTNITGQGKDGPVEVMMIYLKRKRLDDVSALIRSYSPHALITVNDVRKLRNGYMRHK